MTEVYEVLDDVIEAGSTTMLEKPLAPSIFQMGTWKKSNFYLYRGQSLFTKSTCTGDVLYMDFKLPLEISASHVCNKISS